MRSSTAVFVAAAVGRKPNQTIAVTWIPTSVTRVQVDGEAVGVFITQRNVTVCKYISVGQNGVNLYSIAVARYTYLLQQNRL